VLSNVLACSALDKQADHLALLDALHIVRTAASRLNITLDGSAPAPKILLDELGVNSAGGGSRRALRFAPSKGGVPTGSEGDDGDSGAPSGDYINRAIGLLVSQPASAATCSLQPACRLYAVHTGCCL
jgi:hypothetical protein